MEQPANIVDNQPPQPQKDVKLVDIPINDENTSLNVMVSFLSLAQKEVHLQLMNLPKFGNVLEFFKNLFKILKI